MLKHGKPRRKLSTKTPGGSWIQPTERQISSCKLTNQERSSPDSVRTSRPATELDGSLKMCLTLTEFGQSTESGTTSRCHSTEILTYLKWERWNRKNIFISMPGESRLKMVFPLTPTEQKDYYESKAIYTRTFITRSTGIFFLYKYRYLVSLPPLWIGKVAT